MNRPGIVAGLLIALTASLSSGITLAAGDAAAGKAKSAVCAACHGATGLSPNDMWPNLAGQKQPYLAQSIRAYRDGQRTDPMMSGMAQGLSDQDTEDLAAYFAAQAAGK